MDLREFRLAAIENHAQLLRFVVRKQMTSEQAAKIAIEHACALSEQFEEKKPAQKKTSERPAPLPASGGPCEACMGQGSRLYFWPFSRTFFPCRLCSGSGWRSAEIRKLGEDFSAIKKVFGDVKFKGFGTVNEKGEEFPPG